MLNVIYFNQNAFEYLQNVFILCLHWIHCLHWIQSDQLKYMVRKSPELRCFEFSIIPCLFHVFTRLFSRTMYYGLNLKSVNCFVLRIQQKPSNLPPGVLCASSCRLTPLMKNMSPLQSRLPSSSACAVGVISPLLHSWPAGPCLTALASKRSLRYTLRVLAILSPIWNRSRFLWSLGQRKKRGKCIYKVCIYHLSVFFLWPREKSDPD